MNGISASDASDRVAQLLALTQRLTTRLEAELKAFTARLPHEVAASQPETQALANIYRHESARIRADPSLIAGASVAARRELALATQAFEDVLERHGHAVEAASALTEGLVRAIAEEVGRQRMPAAGYGPGARSNAADTSAITLNRRA